MRHWLLMLSVAVVVTTVGCSDTPKPAGKSTQEAIDADIASQKKIEQEERGVPIGKKK